MIIFYIVPFVLLYLFNLTENITNLYQTISNQEKERQVRNSLFKITHEVKNPIAVCKGYLEMLDPTNQKQTEKYINIIKQEIERSLNIMNDFMEFSKIKIEKEIIDINMLLDDINDSLKVLIKHKNIKYIYNQNEDERYIEADYNRLKQVFINIVKNSIEAIDKKGIIEITSNEDEDNYYIIIKDNGIGMNEYTLNNIKEMFYTTKRNGTGLGVALSNEIIKSHNGELIYDSVENSYTKVTIKLPKYVL
jgi:signal transduction histidine kinase